jgi:hypothetical protein
LVSIELIAHAAYIDPGAERYDNHADSKNSRFEPGNPSTHQGFEFIIDVTGEGKIWTKMKSRASLRRGHFLFFIIPFD